MQTNNRSDKVFFSQGRKGRLLIVMAALAAMLTGALVSGLNRSHAQSNNSGNSGPDYSKVNDFTNGRKHLLRNDDLVVGVTTSTNGSYSAAPTTDSKIGSFSNYAGASSSQLTNRAVGRFFNTDRDYIVQTDGTASGFISVTSRQDDGFLKDSWYTSPVPGLDPARAYNIVLMAVADFNGDGYDDIVRGIEYPGEFRIITAADVENPESGLKLGPATIVKNDGLRVTTIGDFDGDGIPEIAALHPNPGFSWVLAIYRVNPKTLEISLAASIQVEDGDNIRFAMAAGQFTAASHQQIIFADQNGDGQPVVLHIIDFDTDSLQPKFVLGWDSGLKPRNTRMVLKTGRFDWSSPYDQVAMLTTNPPDNTDLRIITVDPASYAITNKSVVTSGGNTCGWDIAIGNFDKHKPSPLDPSKTERDPNSQLAILSADCTDNQGAAIGIYNVDPGSFQLTAVLNNALPADLVSKETKFSLLAGDLQGRSYRLGAVSKITIETTQPSLALAAPPMHVDYITSATGTAPGLLNLSVIPTAFFSKYEVTDTSKGSTSDTSASSWSFGAKESYGTKFSIGNEKMGDGASVKDTFKASQDLKGSSEKTNSSYQSKDFSLTQQTGFDDQIWYKDTTFYIYVYPIIGRKVCPSSKPTNCQESEKVPATIQFSSPTETDFKLIAASNIEWYQPPWEYGNVFSYPASYSQLTQIVKDIDKLSTDVTWYTDGGAVTQQTKWSSGKESSQTSSFAQNYSFENDFSVSATGGIFGIATGNVNAELDLSGSFGFSNLQKSVTTLGSSTGISVTKPGGFADPSFYAYAVTPYIFGQKSPDSLVDTIPLSTGIQTSGFMRTAFVANPTDPSAGKWWLQSYGSAPDVALNHPTRWSITKEPQIAPLPANCRSIDGVSMNCANLAPSQPDNPMLSEFHAMRGFFISSANFPGQGPQLSNATAGDKLTLQTRVYNYSRKTMDAGTKVHVRFYGTPWDHTTSRPIGDSFQIGNDVVLNSIPPFDGTPNAPLNWVLANSADFDTTAYSNQYLTFWVVVWMQKADGTMAQEIGGHGLNRIPGVLKSLKDVSEEQYDNNVGFYNSVFYVFPKTTSVAARPPALAVPELKMGPVNVSATAAKPGQPVEVSAQLQIGNQSLTGAAVYFYDGDPAAGGRLFDVERIPHIRANDKYLVRVKFRSNDCGQHRIFIKAAEGKAHEVTGQSQQFIQVECPLAACGTTACLRSAQYYALNLNNLPRGMVTIAGAGPQTKVSTSDTTRMKLLLQGGTAAQQKFNQQFAAAQLNLLSLTDPGKAALRSTVSCYKINFQPVQLKSGVTLSPEMTLGALFNVAGRAASGGNVIDQRLIGNLFNLLNGNDPSGRCSPTVK